MTVLGDRQLTNVGIDAVALKPSETDIEQAHHLDVETVTIDYEGREHVPDPPVFESLATDFEVRATVPIRADGFDPLGDDTLYRSLPESVRAVFVAGHPAYLDDEEKRRTIAPRLDVAASAGTDYWVGTEGIERIALAAGGTQFELLSRRTVRDVRALRGAGFDGSIAIYAPTVLSDDTDEILDAVGDYAARRKPVKKALPDDVAYDSTIDGSARETLLAASRDYALVGDSDTVARRVAELEDAGVDHVVAYPARGLDRFVS